VLASTCGPAWAAPLPGCGIPGASRWTTDPGPAPPAPQLPNKKIKVAAWIIGVTGLGVGIPVFAVVYQQSKLKA
jgi:hypothetical protein